MRYVPADEDERGLAWLRRAAWVVLVAGMVACAGESGSAPADPSLLEPGETRPFTTTTAGAAGAPPGPTTTVDFDGVEPDHVEPPDPSIVPVTALPSGTTRTALPGFGEVVVEVRRVDGQVVEWCLLLAERPEQTQRGLMEVTDPALGGYDGMLFRFGEERVGGFYMRNTPLPLEMTYLDAEGNVVSIHRMEPCADIDGCPSDDAGGAFVRVVETPVAAGGANALGLEPGAVLVDTGHGCSAS